MNFKTACLAIACAVTTATGAHAASTSFASIGTAYPFDGATGYADGGVTLKYVGANSAIWTTSQPTAPSGLSWYAPGLVGYTDISLTSGGSFHDIALLLGTGDHPSMSPFLSYAFVANGDVVASGIWGPLPTYGSGFVTTNLYSATAITDLWVQAAGDPEPFSAANLDALAIGRVTLDGTPAVPEPAGWALALAGLGALGAATRRRARGRDAARA